MYIKCGSHFHSNSYHLCVLECISSVVIMWALNFKIYTVKALLQVYKNLAHYKRYEEKYQCCLEVYIIRNRWKMSRNELW